MQIYIGSDHRGYMLKEKVKEWLDDWGYSFEDKGAYEVDPKDDYTTYATKVASLVSRQKTTRGILICGSGVGIDIAANKFDGIRASVGKTAAQVEVGRNDDDMNVLILAADYTEDDEAKEMVKVFLETRFSGKKRFKRRLEDIKEIEANN